MHKKKKRPINREILLKTQQASRFTSILTFSALVLAVLIYFLGHSLKWLTYAQFLVVLTLLYGFFHFKSLLLIENKTASFFSDWILVMLVAGFSIWIQVTHYDLPDEQPLWMITWPIFGGLMLAFLISIWSYPLSIEKSIGYLLAYGLILLGASYGIVKYTDVIMDNSNPVRHHCSIIDKRIYKGKSTYYYVTIDGWNGNVSPQKIDVDAKYYDQVNIGQEVKVDVYPGRLHIPWFQLIRE